MEHILGLLLLVAACVAATKNPYRRDEECDRSLKSARSALALKRAVGLPAPFEELALSRADKYN